MKNRAIGYSASASRLVICGRETEIVRQIFRAFADSQNPMPLYAVIEAAAKFDGQQSGDNA